MTDLKYFEKEIVKFRNEREWKQFHTPKDSAIALASEAIELLDEFKFKDENEISKYLKTSKEKVSDELVDVLFWTLLMFHDLEIDLPKAFIEKMEQNRKKYPIEKAKGKNTKYTDL